MEWNYVAICIFATIGFAIPFVICCLVFFVCDPKIPKNPQVKILYIHIILGTKNLVFNYYHIIIKLSLEYYIRQNGVTYKAKRRFSKQLSEKTQYLADRRHSTTAYHNYSHQTRPCEHCKMIDKGDVAMYQVTCPKCGEIPNSRKHLFPNITTTDVRINLKTFINASQFRNIKQIAKMVAIIKVIVVFGTCNI